MAESTRQHGERLQIMLNPEELDAVDDFRFKKRMPSRAAAVHELLKPGTCGRRIFDSCGRCKIIRVWRHRQDACGTQTIGTHYKGQTKRENGLTEPFLITGLKFGWSGLQSFNAR
jgi:hypothetical protein